MSNRIARSAPITFHILFNDLNVLKYADLARDIILEFQFTLDSARWIEPRREFWAPFAVYDR